jgi:signal transduction histidine kinase
MSNAKDAINERWKRNRAEKEERKIVLSISKTARLLQMEISDTGCGIPNSLLQKIFTPYFTTKGTATGTGIGLYMAKMIVEKEMHGQINAESLAFGARFLIELPLSELKGKMHA